MKTKLKYFFVLIIFMSAISCLQEKEDVEPETETTTDTSTGTTTGGETGTSSGSTTGTTGGSTTTSTSICDVLAGTSSTANATTEICFETQVLPLFISNCASSGCHDATSHRDGYNLTTYASITKSGISSGSASKSKLYTIMASTGNNRMPPAPAAQLSTEKLAIIRDWINQGAKNTTCQSASTGTIADTVKISYSQHLKPILDTYCYGCHSGLGASQGINVDTYTGLKTIANSGQLYGSISQQANYSPMPPSGKLSDCQIKAFKLWIDQGMANN